jgi:hypothetical protein
LNRRGFLTGLASALAAPAVVRSGILMPLRGVVMPAPSLGRWEGIRFIEDTGGFIYSDELSNIMRSQLITLREVQLITLREVTTPIEVETDYIGIYHPTVADGFRELIKE